MKKILKKLKARNSKLSWPNSRHGGFIYQEGYSYGYDSGRKSMLMDIISQIEKEIQLEEG